MAVTKFLDRQTGEGQTVGAVSVDLITYAIPVSSNVTVDSVANLYETTPTGGRLQSVGSISRGAGAPAIDNAISPLSSILNAALAGSTLTIVISGNNIIVRGTGVAGKTINWFVDSKISIYTP